MAKFREPAVKILSKTSTRRRSVGATWRPARSVMRCVGGERRPRTMHTIENIDACANVPRFRRLVLLKGLAISFPSKCF